MAVKEGITTQVENAGRKVTAEWRGRPVRSMVQIFQLAHKAE